MVRTSAASATGLWLFAALGGCAANRAAPVPLAGPMPRSIVIWPRLAAPFDRQPEVFAGLDLAVRQRGYDVRSLAVGQQLLADAELLATAAPEVARIGAALAVDAVLCVDVREFTTVGEQAMSAARWNIGWQLVATNGGGVLWSHSHRGSWDRRDTEVADPLRRDGAEPGIVPIGGGSVPNFRDVVDVAAWVHRHGMERLPQGHR